MLQALGIKPSPQKGLGRQMQKFSLFVLPVLFALTIGAAAAAGLAAPSLFIPVENAYLPDNTPRFEWFAIGGGAENYELQISGDNAFSENASTRSNITTTSFEPENSLPDNFYCWRVRAGRANGEVGSWSQPRSFTIDTVFLPYPTLVSPGAGAYLRLSDIGLSWSAVSGASSYRVLVDDAPNFSSPLENTVVTGTSYTLPAPPPKAYYWKVASRDLAGNENYPGVRELVVDNIAPTVVLQSPVDGANTNDNTPLLKWIASDDWSLENYEVWVDGVVVGVVTDVAKNEITVPELLDGRHRWSVRAFDNAGNVGSPSDFSFFVDTVLPPTPEKSSPTNGAKLTTNAVDFSWPAVTDRGIPAQGYELWIDGDNDFSSPTKLENVSENHKSVELQDGSYYWRVRAVDNAGNMGGFENSWSFMVDNTPPPRPKLVWPEDNVTENTSRPTFSWQAVSDFSKVTYDIQLDDDNTFLAVPFLFVSENTTFTPDDNIPDDDYWWRVRAVDNFGHVGEWSENLKLIVIMRDFAIRAGFEIKVEQGGGGSRTIESVGIGSYHEDVFLSATGQPAGVDVEFTGRGIPPFNHIMYIAAGENAAIGDYTITIHGWDANGWERTADFTLKVLQKHLARIAHISAGDVVTVSAGRYAVSELEVGASSAVENVVLYLWSTGAPEVAPSASLVYSYFNLESDNLEGNLSSLKINFGVDRSWVQQNNVDLQTVKLVRYQDGVWQELVTQQPQSDANTIYFSASSPGLSTFAIVAEQNPISPGPPGIVYLVPILAVVAGAVSWFLRGRIKFTPGSGAPQESKDKRAPNGKDGRW